jgi:hexosaminidase
MKALVVVAFVIGLALDAVGFREEEFHDQFKLLPYPQKLELTGGRGLLYSDLTGIFLGYQGKRPVMEGLLASLPLSTGSSKGIVTLLVAADLDVPSDEGYSLEIRDQQVIIRAKSESGLFYGLQTLHQLVEDSYDQRIEIPALKITDYPAIAYRAIHLDLKHHLDGTHYYYEMLDKLASVKINAVIIEFEDKLRYRKYPEVGAKHAISVEEFIKISQYAKERNIEISPLIQGLGHASFILKHESMKHLRDDPSSDWVFDPMNPATYEVQFSLYDDAIAATPYGKYLHVGGDEVGDLGKSELSKKSGKNAFDLQMHWLKKVCDYAQQHGRTAIFWDDMVFKLSGLYKTTWDPEIPAAEVEKLWSTNRSTLDKSIDLFPRNCVYMRWNYSHPHIPGNIVALDWYNSHGLKVMAATAAQTMWAMMPRDRSNFKPIKDYARITAEKKLTGILCTIWDDTSPHFETVWRGVYDFGSATWNHRDVTADEAHAIFRHRYYAPEATDPLYEFQDLLEDMMTFWETALIVEGDRSNYHKSFKLLDLPEHSKAGVWTSANRKKLDEAHKAFAQYGVIKTRLDKTAAVSRRNPYSIEVMRQINELQMYPAQLLMLFEKYDQAPAKNKNAAASEISKFIDRFSKVRSDFEAVYARTRILGNPEGYQLDSNLHDHLANGTNNTDWMYMYELPMIEKVRQWLAASPFKG